MCVCLLSERWHGEISEGGGGEDAKGHHSVLFPRGHQLGSSDRIPQVQLLLLPLFMVQYIVHQCTRFVLSLLCLFPVKPSPLF